MRVRLRRNRAFTVVGVEGVLRDRRGNATRAGEDFADVIHRLAPGVGHIGCKAMETPHLEFILQAIVFRPCAVVANAQVVKVAVHTARTAGGHIGDGRVAGSSGLRGRAWRSTRWDQAGSLNRQARCASAGHVKRTANEGVAVDRLEVSDSVVAHITGLKRNPG